MTLSHSTDNIFVGIDVGGAGLDVAWHRGECAHYANCPEAIAALVERLRSGPKVTRIVVEPTGGYEKPLVKALRRAKLPVEVIHTTRLRRTASWSASRPSPIPRMPGSWRPMPPPPTRCAAARPLTSNCRRTISARPLPNSQAAATSSNT